MYLYTQIQPVSYHYDIIELISAQSYLTAMKLMLTNGYWININKKKLCRNYDKFPKAFIGSYSSLTSPFFWYSRDLLRSFFWLLWWMSCEICAWSKIHRNDTKIKINGVQTGTIYTNSYGIETWRRDCHKFKWYSEVEVFLFSHHLGGIVFLERL